MALLGGAGLVDAAIRSGNQGDSRCGAARPPPRQAAACESRRARVRGQPDRQLLEGAELVCTTSGSAACGALVAHLAHQPSRQRRQIPVPELAHLVFAGTEVEQTHSAALAQVAQAVVAERHRVGTV
ncbi:hypothetical protein ACWGJT_21865 [Streptomyces xantholiticus]